MRENPVSHLDERARRRRLIAVLLVLVMAGLLAAIGDMLNRQYHQTASLRDAVNRSYETQIQIQRVLSVLQDIETGQRGYLLSGDPDFLQPHNDALSKLAKEFVVLREAIGKVPEAQRRVARIEELSLRKIEFDERTIAQHRSAPAAALPVLRQGKETMDQIRVEVADLEAEEDARLKEREVLALASRETNRLAGLGLVAFLGAILLVLTVVIVRSARQRHEALVRLEDSGLRNRAILDSTVDAILTLNPSGSIETLNKAATRIYGYTEEDLLRRDVGKLFANPPADGQIPRFLKQLGRAKGAQSSVREVLSRRSDGTTFPTDVAIGPMQLTEGIRYVAVIRDITERKRVEQMKAEFVATVSHELRTPLTSIAGSLGLLAGGAAGELPERAARLIGIAHNNSERLVRLINDILDMEKVESGNMVFHNVPVALHPLLVNIAEANRGFAEHFGASVTIAGEGAEASVASADPDRLTQVVTNLLSNAIKFSGEGGQVKLEITPGERWHRITVRDNGPGIDEAFKSRVFEKFAQEDSSNTRQKGGTGLGLAIAREIVTRLQGRITFETETGQGTAFHVDLPALQPARDARPYVLLVSATAGEAGPTARSLEAAGHTCKVAGTVVKALALASERRPAAILIELALPDEGGIVLIRALRQDPRLAAIPILVVVGENGEVNEALSIVDWLAKPVRAERLSEALEDALAAAASPSSRVLHVDDDPDVLDIVSAALDGRADVISVTSLERAREILASDDIDLVILDLGLADGSGTELLPCLRRSDGTLVPVIIFSAEDADPALADEVDAVLTKSRTSLGRLVETVAELVARGQQNERQHVGRT